MKSLLLAAILAMAAGAVGQQPATKPHEERYASATIDSYGHLVIRTTDGREIIPRMDRATFDSEGRLVLTPMSEPVRDDEQGGFASPAISADKRTVGWLALFPGCCGFGGNPLYLVLYFNGNFLRLQGRALPLYRWCFVAEGKQVAFGQEDSQDAGSVHYELRDARTGEPLAQYNPLVGEDGQVVNEKSRPDWVKAVDAAR